MRGAQPLFPNQIANVHARAAANPIKDTATRTRIAIASSNISINPKRERGRAVS